jgi:hypothetical protein
MCRIGRTAAVVISAALGVTLVGHLVFGPFTRTISYARAEDAPEPPPLPDLTPEGARWGRRLIRNAIKISKGRNVKNPPFVDFTVAQSIALAVRVARKTKKRSASMDALRADPDFVALLAFVRSQIAASPSESLYEYRAGLLEALNAFELNFPVISSSLAVGGSIAQGNTAPEYRPLEILTTTEAQALISDRRVQESERRFWDGALIIDDSPGTPPATNVYYVNGVTNTIEDGIGETHRIKTMLGGQVPVHHIHNGTAGTIKGPFNILGLTGDALEALRQRLLGATPNDPAPQRVTQQILADLAAGKSSLLICHSQGAQVCINGLRNALQQAPQDADRILANTRFISLGGYAKDSDWPEGTRVDIWKNPQDPVPGLAGALSPEGVANLLRLLTTDSHQVRRYLNACVAQNPPPADCPCRSYDKCAEVLESLRQLCADEGLDCPGLDTTTTSTSTSSTTSTTSTTLPSCQNDLECNPGAIGDRIDGDSDCLWNVCSPSDSRADANGCVIGATVETVCSPCAGGEPSPGSDRTPCCALHTPWAGSCCDDTICNGCTFLGTDDRCNPSGICRAILCFAQP